MSLSMYEASIPVFIRMLKNLSVIMTKAADYAELKKINPSVLINARLAPDMFPLVRQIQIATDSVKGCAARLATIAIPSFSDTEASFEEIQERISKTLSFLSTISASQIDGTEENAITLTLGGHEMTFSGQQYLLNFVIPNFYFHLTTAYAILRHNGLDIGKKDFLGG